MAQFDEIDIRDAAAGLITNVSAVDANRSSFRELKNVDLNTPGIIKNLKGFGTASVIVDGTSVNIPDLPSGFTLERAWRNTIVSPAESDVIVLFGTKDSRDRMYVWPDITDSSGNRNTANSTLQTAKGSRVSNTYINWLELTEAEAVTVNVVTDDQNYTLTGLENGTTADYYIGWYIYNNNRGFFDLITDSDASSGIVTKYGITGTLLLDDVILMRFPVFKKGSTIIPHYQFDNTQGVPSLAKHSENIGS
jgi:hypothetical protein